MAIAIPLIVGAAGASAAAYIWERLCGLPDGEAKRQHNRSWRGLLTNWAFSVIGFACAQLFYGHVSNGHLWLTGRTVTPASLLYLPVFAFATALGSWWTQRTMYRDKTGRGEDVQH